MRSEVRCGEFVRVAHERDITTYTDATTGENNQPTRKARDVEVDSEMLGWPYHAKLNTFKC